MILPYLVPASWKSNNPFTAIQKTTMIKNIIFDLGNVLFDIDFHKLKPAFEKLGIRDFDKQYSLLHASDIFLQLEKGEIEPKIFYDLLRKESGLSSTNELLEEAWNSMLLQFRWSSVEFLQKHKTDYRMFLLSNTNYIHQQCINQMLYEKTGITELRHLFEKAYFSHEINMRKPDPAIYQHVINDAQLNPAETIFIDDVEANIKPARSAGLEVHLLKENESIELLPYFSNQVL